jgi:hypothetical protein
MTSQEPRTVAMAPVRHAATVTSSMMAVTCTAGLLGAWAAWHHHQVAVDYVAGEPGIGVAAYVGADNTSAGTGLLWLLAGAVTAVMFLTWSWRARCNAELLSPLPHRLTRGWTVGSWFVPGLNAYLPRAVMEDIWRTSRPDAPGDAGHARELPRAWLVHYWWYAVLASGLAALWLWVSHLVEPTVEELRDVAAVSTVLAVLQLVAAALAIPVIRRVTRWQAERVGR